MQKNQYLLPISIFLSALLVSGAIGYAAQLKYGGDGVSSASSSEKATAKKIEAIREKVLPKKGISLPIEWGDIGKQMVEKGVFDMEKYETIAMNRGGMDETVKKMLTEEVGGKIRMTPENAQALLNVFWAFGLSNDNDILKYGEMSDPTYGGAQNFASTGGWTISKGDSMDHFSKHAFVALTPQQQELVEKVSKNIYRPCCGNSTHFPDCNHGMAMLGLLELLAAQDISEDEMYKIALQVNAYWFPDTYQTIALYLQKKNMDYSDLAPNEILSSEYSSGQGYRKILMEVSPPQTGGSGGGCSV